MGTRNGNNESSDGTTGEKINNGIAFVYQLCYNYVTNVITSSKHIKKRKCKYVSFNRDFIHCGGSYYADKSGDCISNF